MEGFLYYFDFERATRMLKAIQAHSGAGSVLLADHINDFTLSSLKVPPHLPLLMLPSRDKSSLTAGGCLGMQAQAGNKWLTSTFSSSMESPEEALGKLGESCHLPHLLKLYEAVISSPATRLLRCQARRPRD